MKNSLLTGLLGHPSEQLHCEPIIKLYEQEKSFKAVINVLTRGTTSPDGVWGTKIDYYHLYVIKKYLRQENLEWSDIFPDSYFIFLTRRDKLKQAISWLKSQQDGVMGLKELETNNFKGTYFYSRLEIEHLVYELCLAESRWLDFFNKENISPFHITYEDYVQDPEKYTFQILDYLNVSYSPTERLFKSSVTLKIQSNEINKNWLERLVPNFDPQTRYFSRIPNFYDTIGYEDPPIGINK